MCPRDAALANGPTLPSPTILAASSSLLAAAALAVALSFDLRKFLAGTPVLTSISGVVAFRRAVTRQMYGALGVLGLAGAGAVVVTVGLVVGTVDWREVPGFLAAVAVFGGCGLWCRIVERRAKEIPVVDEEIGRERDRVVRVWTTKPLPTWRERASA